jgi:hypothetical protein
MLTPMLIIRFADDPVVPGECAVWLRLRYGVPGPDESVKLIKVCSPGEPSEQRLRALGVAGAEWVNQRTDTVADAARLSKAQIPAQAVSGVLKRHQPLRPLDSRSPLTVPKPLGP